MEKRIYCGDAALRRKVASITAPWSKPNRGTVVLPWLSAVFDGRSLFKVPGGTPGRYRVRGICGRSTQPCRDAPAPTAKLRELLRRRTVHQKFGCEAGTLGQDTTWASAYRGVNRNSYHSPSALIQGPLLLFLPQFR
jgi:hypothetical protein